MTRRLLGLMAIVAFALLASACSDDAPVEVPSRVGGVLTDIESEGIGDIKAFTVKDGDTTYEILIDSAVDYRFNLGHLQEHLSGSLPVIVEIEERDGALYAQTIEDA